MPKKTTLKETMVMSETCICECRVCGNRKLCKQITKIGEQISSLLSVKILQLRPRGCICPIGAENTCKGFECPRMNSWKVTGL